MTVSRLLGARVALFNATNLRRGTSDLCWWGRQQLTQFFKEVFSVDHPQEDSSLKRFPLLKTRDSSERCEAFTRPLLCCIMCLEPTCRCSWMNESLRPALVSSPSLIAAPSARLEWCWQRKIKTHVLKEQSCDWHLEIIPAFVSCPGWWDHGAGHPPVFLTSPPCWWGLSQWADELSPRTIWITRAYMSEISQHSGSPGGSETLHLQSCAQAASNVLVPTFLPFWAIDPPRSLSLKQLMVCCCWNKVLPPNVL